MDKLGVADLEVAGRRVFTRADFNVPMAAGAVPMAAGAVPLAAGAPATVADDTRIRASLETINDLRRRGARVVLASHLGRPDGQPRPEFSLQPVAERLADLLIAPVRFSRQTTGPEAEAAVAGLVDGEVLLLENLRFSPGEKRNDAAFAQALARLADLYVNDAFGTCHRAHASIVGITKYVEAAAAGHLLGREIAGLSRAIRNPERPFLLLLGGAKVDDKIAVIEGLLEHLDVLAIGGAMALTFLKASGCSVGRSRVEDDRLDIARRILAAAAARGVEVLLPEDHVAAPALSIDAPTAVVESVAFPPQLMGLDIGPATRARFGERIQTARTIVWNGPMGVFELAPFAAGTLAIAQAVAASSGYSVVGGGDSVAAIQAAGVTAAIGHVSTGGGAALAFLAGAELPGLSALSDARR